MANIIDAKFSILGRHLDPYSEVIPCTRGMTARHEGRTYTCIVDESLGRNPVDFPDDWAPQYAIKTYQTINTTQNDIAFDGNQLTLASIFDSVIEDSDFLEITSPQRLTVLQDIEEIEIKVWFHYRSETSQRLMIGGRVELNNQLLAGHDMVSNAYVRASTGAVDNYEAGQWIIANIKKLKVGDFIQIRLQRLGVANIGPANTIIGKCSLFARLFI